MNYFLLIFLIVLFVAILAFFVANICDKDTEEGIRYIILPFPILVVGTLLVGTVSLFQSDKNYLSTFEEKIVKFKNYKWSSENVEYQGLFLKSLGSELPHPTRLFLGEEKKSEKVLKARESLSSIAFLVNEENEGEYKNLIKKFNTNFAGVKDENGVAVPFGVQK